MNNVLNNEEKGMPIIWAILLAYSLLIPEQIFIYLFNFVLFPYRLLLICMIPGILSSFVNGTVRGRVSDIVILTAMIWIVTALSFTIGIDRALANGGASALDIGASYFAARCTITSGERARLLLVRIGPAFLIAGISIIVETASGRYILQPFVASLLGVKLEGPLFASVSGRLGLIRGTGPFGHPILAGLQLASVLPLFLLARMKLVPRSVGVVAAVFSLGTVSSSALIALILAVVLVSYEYIGSLVKSLTWKLLVIGTGLGAVALQLFTRGGIVGIVVNFLTLDKWTAYYRTLVWQYGVMNVAMHPWLGNGFSDWIRPAWMPVSIDNYWLLMAMTYGVPEAVMRISLPILVVFAAGSRMASMDMADRRVLLGFSITIVILTLMAFTVAFWGVTQAWYYFLIGTTLSLAEGGRQVTAPMRRPGVDHLA